MLKYFIKLIYLLVISQTAQLNIKYNMKILFMNVNLLKSCSILLILLLLSIKTNGAQYVSKKYLILIF